ncbi:uncharacterized protein [Gossypium hirsutum]|uniref:Tf2-1-like SH3-like domain-containing protein n=1 Tax=Gossypium hirsutum TaxID=3635 RepID=A0A1U8PVQ6_GOSHI|nr:uncharacterized protein LOC107963169 [Gossypium hirsutum]
MVAENSKIFDEASLKFLVHGERSTHGLLGLLVQELSGSPATVSPQTLSTKAVVASLNLFARARVIGPTGNSRGSSLAADNSGGVGNCTTTWITKNDCFRSKYKVLESLLADIMGKTWDEVIIFNHLSSPNGWPNRGGKLSFVNFVASVDARKNAEFVKELHRNVRENIESRTEQYVQRANKGRKRVVFEPGDWVWVHMRKERFLAQRRSKLFPRGDGPFQVIKRINENSYKLDLPGEYNILT